VEKTKESEGISCCRNSPEGKKYGCPKRAVCIGQTIRRRRRKICPFWKEIRGFHDLFKQKSSSQFLM
jgi:hypothetical protein